MDSSGGDDGLHCVERAEGDPGQAHAVTVLGVRVSPIEWGRRATTGEVNDPFTGRKRVNSHLSLPSEWISDPSSGGWSLPHWMGPTQASGTVTVPILNGSPAQRWHPLPPSLHNGAHHSHQRRPQPVFREWEPAAPLQALRPSFST